MATDKTAAWSLGESVLWQSPTAGVDALWSGGESTILDDYTGAAPTIPVWCNIGGVWKQAVSISVNIGGVWKAMSAVGVKIGGVWK